MHKALLCILFLLIFITTSAPSYANPKYSSLVVNARNGDVLYARKASMARYPASLTKLMTLYIAFEMIEKGKLHMNKKLRVSRRSARQPRSKLYLRSGSYITTRDAIYALTIRSANDVAVVLAEAIAGTERKFAIMMTKKARLLGMKHTVFRNASGLHHSMQKTTAYDMARLAVALRRDFPKYYKIFSKKFFKYRGSIISSSNKVIKRYNGADGLKTGFLNASGYNLITTTTKAEGSLIGVVFGGRTARRRDNHMIMLLNKGYGIIRAQRKASAKKRQQSVKTKKIIKRAKPKIVKPKTVKPKIVTPKILQKKSKNNSAFEVMRRSKKN